MNVGVVSTRHVGLLGMMAQLHLSSLKHKVLNREGVPVPPGGIWGPGTIAGDGALGGDVLGNEFRLGRLVGKLLDQAQPGHLRQPADHPAWHARGHGAGCAAPPADGAGPLVV